MKVTAKMVEFRDLIESEFSAFDLVAYWDAFSDDDLGGEVVTLRVLNVPSEALVDVDRFCYRSAYKSMGFDWDFLIDIRDRRESLVGGCFADDYAREFARLTASRAPRRGNDWRIRPAAPVVVWRLGGAELPNRTGSYASVFLTSTADSWIWEFDGSAAMLRKHERELVAPISRHAGAMVCSVTAAAPLLPEVGRVSVDVAGGTACLEVPGLAPNANTHYSLAA